MKRSHKLLLALLLSASVTPVASASLTYSLPVILTGQGVAFGQATPVAVAIDIQPNRTPNRVYLSKNYTIYVAVLGSSTFSVADLQPGTVRFGRAGTEASAVLAPVIRDLNADGRNDALYGFLTFDCGFALGDALGWWTGTKTGNVPVNGSDSVLVSP